MTSVQVKRALVSVYDKTGLISFGRLLADLGIEIVSSGGTAAALQDAGVPVVPVAQVTGASEILGGRVKTLHPAIHGALLARTDSDSDMAELAERGIDPFQLVVVNLYPFRETLARPHTSEDELIEMIDIGGPAMIRAAAKNHRHVGVVTDPDQYQDVGDAIAGDGLDDQIRRELAARAFFLTASYDAAIVNWLGGGRVVPLRRVADLRYGENPHQSAAIFVEPGENPWWARATQHQGKLMSFNNYADAEAAWRLVHGLSQPAVAVIKHTNPAGVAEAPTVLDAFRRAWDGDPLSAFGSVIAINGTLDSETALAVTERFVEVVIATDATPEALEVLAAKQNLRILTAAPPLGLDADYRRLEGGFLVQSRDDIDTSTWEVVSEVEPEENDLAALRFAWVVAANAKSNAIVLAKGNQAVGVGAGDQSRVGAAERAIARAGDRARGSVAASDAFFPFRDGVDALAAAGVRAVVEPGGSINDQEVIDAANEHGISLVFTGRRHFKH